MNSDDAWGAANRMSDAADQISRAADEMGVAARKIFYLLEDGYGGNGVRLIELLENLENLNITKAAEAKQKEAVQADLVRDAERYRRIRSGPQSDRYGNLVAVTFQADGDVPFTGEALDLFLDTHVNAALFAASFGDDDESTTKRDAV